MIHENATGYILTPRTADLAPPWAIG